MKLWEKEYQLDELIENFTTSEDRKLDLLLAKYDIEGSLAHARMINSIGFIDNEELMLLTTELESILKLIDEDRFTIEQGVEDVHSQVEILLTRKLGDIGKKIHLGRSRNDQVLLDLRLFFRDQLSIITQKTLRLAEQLLKLSIKHQDDLMPGYTHMQVAMVSSFGLWFGAFAESFLEDAAFTKNVQEQINKNPLGTAAGYGSSIAVDREKTTQELKFSDICVNSIFSQIARGKTELLVAYTINQLAFSLGKLAMDICQYSGQNFGFVKLSDEFTTGSSIMPHKKNPDVFELIRAHCNQLSTLPQQINSILGNLTAGYHRDFQVVKEILFPSLEKLNSILDITTHALPNLQIFPPDLSDDKYQYLYSVEVVNDLVKKGESFRNAYQEVSKSIENGTFNPIKDLDHTHIGSIGNLGTEILENRLKKLKND